MALATTEIFPAEQASKLIYSEQSALFAAGPVKKQKECRGAGPETDVGRVFHAPVDATRRGLDRVGEGWVSGRDGPNPCKCRWPQSFSICHICPIGPRRTGRRGAMAPPAPHAAPVSEITNRVRGNAGRRGRQSFAARLRMDAVDDKRHRGLAGRVAARTTSDTSHPASR